MSTTPGGYFPVPFQTTTDVTTSDTVAGSCVLKGSGDIIAIEVINNSGSTMNKFVVQAQFYPNGPWHDYLGQTDFASSSEYTMIKASSNNIASLTVGSKGFAIIRVDSLYAIQFIAAANSGANITVSWSKKERRLFNG